MSDTVERTSSSQTSQAGDRPAAAASSAEPRPALGPLLAVIDERVPVERRETVAAFAKAYLRRLADDEIAAAPAEELYGLVCSTFEFVDGRRLQPWVVRAFNPEVVTDGFTAPGTILETNVDDSPFLVDSVTEELTARNLVVRRILHPVIGTSRDEEGRLERVSSARDASHRESVMHFELDRRLTDTSRADLEGRVKTILRDVRLVVRDFEPMQDRAHHMLELARQAAVRYSPQEVGETVDFLDWLLQLNFVFLGYREYELVDSPDGRAIRAAAGSGLGILSDVNRSTFADTTLLDSLEPGLRRRIEDGDLLVFSKTNAYSTVHRRARMDYIGVRHVSPDGEIIGEARMIGLFTSKAYMEPAAKTPLLHHKLEQVLTAEDLIPGSHDYKAATTLFESFPKDELFQASAGELRRLISGLLQLNGTAASACWSVAYLTAGASLSSWRCLGIGSTRGCERACRTCSRTGSTVPRSTITCRSARRRTRVSSSPSTSTPACRSRRCRTRSWSKRSNDSRAPGTTTSATRWWRGWVPTVARR